MESSPGPSTSSCSRPEDTRAQSSATGTPRAGTCPHSLLMISFPSVYSVPIREWNGMLLISRYAVHPSEGGSVKVNAEFLKESHPGSCLLWWYPPRWAIVTLWRWRIFILFLHCQLSYADDVKHNLILPQCFLPVMDGSLPTSLKHIISNAEYYGPSLFLLGRFVVVHDEILSGSTDTFVSFWIVQDKNCNSYRLNMWSPF